MKRIVLAIVGLLLVSCGRDMGNASQHVHAAYTYEFAGDNCTTGKHSLNSLTELCQTLRSEGANRGCARPARRDYFDSANCPGHF